MPYQHVFYVSESQAEPADLPSLLAVSRVCNARAGVTGALLFTGQYFAQVLEGTEAAVAKALDRIAADKRHSSMRILQRTALEQRRFAEWSMAYCDLPGADDLIGHLIDLSADPIPTRADRLVELMFQRCAQAPLQSSSSGDLNL